MLWMILTKQHFRNRLDRMHTFNDTTQSAPCFQLKGGHFTLTAVQLLHLDWDLFAKQLAQKITQAPKFFNHAPVVIDCQKVNEEGLKIDFKTLAALLRDSRLIPVGVRNANQQQQTVAILAGLAVLSEGGSPDTPSQIQEKTPEFFKETATETPTRLITQPVRSGQQIYVPGGDLIVTAAVSHGAELLAEGHIHVYGPLRGRALAGVTGDINARIFCHSLEAELVSIAGRYIPCEHLREQYWKQAVSIALQGETLQINPLS